MRHGLLILSVRVNGQARACQGPGKEIVSGAIVGIPPRRVKDFF
jgi:hypothetical protein